MEIILIQDVANLGYKNDIVKVRDGYGRNYLLPNKLAIIANESNRKQLAENLKQQAHKLAKLLADAQALAEKLAAVVITVPVKANEDGKIFGTVTTQQIADALKAQEIEVDKKVITVEPIKQVGEYEATARLHREVKAVIKINVVAEKAEAAE
jgi:large subunit ribosomal protein L9